MLRGMHHLTDVGAGVLMGIGALVVTSSPVACRSLPRRSEVPEPEGTPAHDEGRGLVTTARQVDRRAGSTSFAPCTRWGRRHSIPSGRRCRRASIGPPERVKRVLDEGAEAVFVWRRRRHGAAPRSTCSRIAALPSRSFRRGLRTCSRPVSTSRSDIEQAVEIGLSWPGLSRTSARSTGSASP